MYKKVLPSQEIPISITDFKIIIPKKGSFTVEAEAMFYAYVYYDKTNNNEATIYLIEGLQHMHEQKPVFKNAEVEVEVDLDDEFKELLNDKLELIKKSCNDAK